MSFTLFLALGILAIDFLLYAFFRWTYGEHYRRRARRRANRPALVQRSAVRRSPARSNVAVAARMVTHR